MRKKTISMLLAIAVLAIAIAGCGGSSSTSSSSTSSGLSNDAYTTALKGIMVPLGQSLQTLGTQAQSATSKPQLEAALKGGEAAVQTAIDAVGAIQAPSGASDANAALVTALNSYEDSLVATDDAVANGSSSEIKAQVTQFKTDSQDFVTKLNDIKQQLTNAGINIGG
jgi:hypothetical protein